MEKEESISGSLTDLSSLSSEEEGSSPSHRKFSSASFIVRKKHSTKPYHTTKQIHAVGPSLSSLNENAAAGQRRLPHESGENQNRPISPNMREHGAIPSIRVTSQDSRGDTGTVITSSTSEPMNQLNRSNQSSRKENKLNGRDGPVMNGSTREAVGQGHLFTEEEVHGLQKQVTDLQVDLEQLLQYTHILAQENNALKNILKDAVIVYDDDTMRQFCDTLLVSVHEQPLLKSGLDYDRLPSMTSPAGLPTLSSLSLQPSAHSDTAASCPPRKRQDFSSKSAPVSPLSTRSLSHARDVSSSYHLNHHHHALRVSAQENKLTGFKTFPLDPETTQAKGSIKMADHTGDSASQQAAESMRKLYGLTFTVSQSKAENQGQLEAKKAHQKEEEIDKEEATATSGPFLGSRKPFKMSSRHRKSRKRCAKSEGSPELPRISSDPPSKRKIRTGEKPKFYLQDILPVLKERNQLKEQMHLLEDEVASLKSECGRLRVASNTWVNRHSWAGVLVDFPEEIQTLSASPQSDSKPRAVTMRMHPAVCDKEPYFTDAVAKEYIQRGPQWVYSVEVTRSDGHRFEIYRRYGEFFTFHHTLVQLFPAEVGTYRPKNAILPSLPSIENVLMKSHLKAINVYCQTLLTRVDSALSRSVFVTNFFTPMQKDKQLPRLAKPQVQAKSDFEMSNYFQMSITSTANPADEEYVVLADYVTDVDSELSVLAGDVVQLINRETTGWWLVNLKVKDGEVEKVGLVPGDFLKRYDVLVSENQDSAKEETSVVSSEAILSGVADPSMLYVAIEDYKAEHPHQLSFGTEAQLVVVEICDDGWWLAWAGGKEGWVPASFLLPRTKQDGDVSSYWTTLSGKTTSGLKYMTMAAFTAQSETDLTLPECAVVEVVSKSVSGWWTVRYGESTGLVPASLLALTDVNSPDGELSEDEKVALPMDLGHSISGFVDPPPRSQRYLTMLRMTVTS